jgi:hypothetical protein
MDAVVFMALVGLVLVSIAKQFDVDGDGDGVTA